jgi:hypothetical protein
VRLAVDPPVSSRRREARPTGGLAGQFLRTTDKALRPNGATFAPVRLR